MDNPFNDVMPKVVNQWRSALTGNRKLPVAAQVFRYETQHRDNPAAMQQFFRDRVDKGQLKPEHVQPEMERYVKQMEGEIKRGKYGSNG